MYGIRSAADKGFVGWAGQSEFQAQHDWPSLQLRCHAMALALAQRVGMRNGLSPIAPDDTTETRGPRLARLGGGLLVEALARLGAGQLEPVRQDDALATAMSRLTGPADASP